MKTVILDKDYKKLDKYTQKVIDKSIDTLQSRLNQYLGQNIKINKVFNDDVLIHDIINDMYVFKCRSYNIEIILLYTMKGNTLKIMSFYIKNRTRTLSNQEWITKFKAVTA
jgi:hypothetical protein